MMNNTPKKPSLSETDDSPWLEDDRVWFSQNPHRNFRVRKANYIELTGFGIYRTPQGVWAGVIVNQIAPGARTRTLFASRSGIPKNTDAKAIEIINTCDANRSGAA